MTEKKLIKAKEIMDTFTSSLLENDFESFISLYDENVVFEFPFAPQGSVRKLEGRQGLYDYISRLPEMVQLLRFSKPEIYFSDATSTFIAEFTCEALVTGTGKPYNQTYISVIKLREGKIVHYKDYWNPLVLLESMGQS